MKRGTTPTLKIKLHGIEVDTLTSTYITLKQGVKEITKTGTDVTPDLEENALVISLTQEETLSFNDGEIKIQLRALKEGNIAVASNIKCLRLDDILKEGIIE